MRIVARRRVAASENVVAASRATQAVARRSNPIAQAFNSVVAQMKIAPKMGLLVLLMLAPAVVAGFSYIGTVNDNVALTQNERSGLEVVGPALHVLASLTMADEALPDLAPLKAAVAANPQLGLDEPMAAVEQALAVDSTDTRAAGGAAVVLLIQQAGDASSLILDPELDSYYVMAALVVEIPAALAKHLEADASYIVSEGTPSQAVLNSNVATQALLAGTLEGSAEALDIAVATAVESTADATLAEDLGPMRVLAASLQNEVQKLQSSLQNPAPSDFSLPATSAHDSIDPAVAGLDRLLAARVTEAQNGRNLTIAIITGATLLALGWSVVVWTNTRFGVAVVRSSVKALATRDLSPQLRPPGRDEFAEIGADLDTARQLLADAFSRLADSSGHVADHAKQLTASTANVDNSAHQTLSQSQAATREITTVQTMLAAVSTSGAELTRATAEISHTMAAVNASAQRARTDLEGATDLAEALGESSQQIAASVDAIVGIASKTRLLALNATIEAARAGEAGKGFGVVASEVQTLAQQSAEASDLIGKVAQEQHDAIARVIEALGRAAQAVTLAAEAQATVAAAAEQQTATISQVSDSITGSAEATTRIADQVTAVESVAFGTADTVTQLRQAADEFDALARSLASQVEAFHLK